MAPNSLMGGTQLPCLPELTGPAQLQWPALCDAPSLALAYLCDLLCRYIRCQKEVGKSFERHKLKRQDADAW